MTDEGRAAPCFTDSGTRCADGFQRVETVGVAGVVVLVNGLPGSGKTTLAVQLGALMGLPVLSKDEFKEALADVVGPAFQGPALGRAAMAAIWELAASAQGAVIVDSFWYRPRDMELARAGLRAAGAVRAVELWCYAPQSVARARYAARTRHAVHDDQRRLTGEWQSWASDADPLELCPIVRVDTGTAVNLPAVVNLLNEALWADASQLQ